MQPTLSELLAEQEWTSERLAGLLTFKKQRAFAFAPGSHFPGDLAILAALKSLHTLSFRGSDLSDENLAALGRLPTLARLDLKECRFSAEALAALCGAVADGGAPKLSELWLEGATIGDDSLREVGRLSQLRWLILSRTPISNAGLAHLTGLRKLEALWLNGTRVTDSGLLQLAALPKLSAVPAGGSYATEAGQEALFAAQVAHRKSKRPVDAAARREAQAALWEFLQEMRDWEVAAYERARDIEERHRAERPQPHVMAPGEAQENRDFWRDIGAQKSQIAARFCSPALLARGVGSAGHYGSPPHFDQSHKAVVDVEAPSAGKVIFYTNRPDGTKRRWTLKKIGEKWLVDEVQWWAGGWKRELV